MMCAHSTDANEEEHVTERFCLLVADADPYISRIIEASLEHYGAFEVIPLARGPVGLRQAVERNPDLILWDILLPDTETLLPKLCALCPSSALVLLAPEDRLSLWMSLRRLGIASVLIKPFTIETLRQLIDQAQRKALAPPTEPQLHLFAVGQQVLLRSPQGQSSTRILQVEQDAFWVTGEPQVTLPPDITIGTRIHVELTGETALYRFATKILDRQQQIVWAWKLQMPQTLHRFQRRQYPRVALQAEVRLQPLPSQEELHAVLTDLSLGGCALISPVPLTDGQTVRIVLENIAPKTLQLEGEVQRCKPQSLQGNRYTVALQFTRIPYPTKQELKQIVAKKIEGS
ncbi:PilZ domain-containing protein [Chthonomonas calidirosea]|nr:PilZ domain-containing protein [Chthonomonas calidirosea]